MKTRMANKTDRKRRGTADGGDYQSVCIDDMVVDGERERDACPSSPPPPFSYNLLIFRWGLRRGILSSSLCPCPNFLLQIWGSCLRQLVACLAGRAVDHVTG